MRTTVVDQTIWFGEPGRLIEIPHPRGGVRIEASRERSTFVTGGGQRLVSVLPGARAAYTLAYGQLDHDTAAILREFESGHRGQGPWVLLDPGRINMLTINQSGSTGGCYDTSGFTLEVAAGATLSTDTTSTSNAARSLRVDFATTGPGADPILTLDAAYDDWYGVPIVEGESYAFSLYAVGAGTDHDTTITPQIRWLDEAGSVVGADAAGTALGTASGWDTSARSVSGVAPVSAAYAVPRVVFTASSITAGGRVHLERFQFERGSTATDWAPGLGTNPVEIMGQDDAWRWQAPMFRNSPTVTLIEVAV